MDDYLDSRDTDTDVAILASAVRKVQAEAGFEFRNWRSNSKKVKKTQPISRKNFGIDKAFQIERVLGMAWLPEEDVFVYFVKIPNGGVDYVQVGTNASNHCVRVFVYGTLIGFWQERSLAG